MTGVGPISGMAYDNSTNTMYGVSGSNTTNFYTIDLATGAATTVTNSTGARMGSLAFVGGVLYGGGVQDDAGNLYTIDLATGAATLVGNTGTGRISSMAYCCECTPPAPIPTMSEWALFMLGLLVLTFGVVSMQNRERAKGLA